MAQHLDVGFCKKNSGVIKTLETLKRVGVGGRFEYTPERKHSSFNHIHG